MGMLSEIEELQLTIKQKLIQRLDLNNDSFETLLNNYKSKQFNSKYNTTEVKAKENFNKFLLEIKHTIESKNEAFPNEYEMLSNTLRDIINDANKQNTQRYF
ncbi:hypothetical protein A0H76_2796 [Hepatospora eriocheir]|uniref:Uncharacterized protein n=1 Tax=Hepatospora eriocheir TaxID=1081669 RepID=A0A1X0QF41_9MICR|nr:hypothetical protein A0H76_2796 [Hepatospora eriocheir]